jgi:hypothetical protein
LAADEFAAIAVDYSFGAVRTFTSEGGDEAVRVAVGKNVIDIKAVN